MNEPEQWQQHRAFGALDWASEKHAVVLVKQAGKVVRHPGVASNAPPALQAFPADFCTKKGAKAVEESWLQISN